MRVITVDEKFTNGDTFTLWPLGDLHLGALDCAEDVLRRHVKEIATDPTARWIGMGDYADLILPTDLKRWYPHGVPQRYLDAMNNPEQGIIRESRDHVLEVLEPIRSKCWGLLHGNHETNIVKRHYFDLLSEVAAGLNVRHRVAGYECFFKVRFRRTVSKKNGPEATLLVHAHHGWQGGRRDGAQVNQFDLDVGESDADVFLRGHSHKSVSGIKASFRVNEAQPREWPRAYAVTGTYKRGRILTTASQPPFDSYEQTRGFRPKIDSQLGPPRLQITPRHSGMDKLIAESKGIAPPRFDLRWIQ